MSFVGAKMCIKGKLGDTTQDCLINTDLISAVVPTQDSPDKTALVMINKDVIVVEGSFETVSTALERAR